MSLVVPFATDETPELAQAGGKAMSLILMTRYGLPVPDGFVLTVAFFAPWLEQIQNTPAWDRVLDALPEELERNCNAVQELALRLELDDGCQEALSRALATLQGAKDTALFAVRSSSPEEDLEGFSFAGGYETTLGVTAAGLQDAVRRSFASCFDERIFLYKQQHGLPVDKPRIAVIVQQQVPADRAGVAFSLNPVNNCYDEAVVNANFGLGESVVSGQVSPDSFIVDKVSRAILEKKVGKKETSVWLAADGGTYQQPAPSRGQPCLSEDEVLALTALLIDVEDYYQKPIDVEWALAAGNLYLLQARPITAYVPLPTVMQTVPGEPRLLYIDYTLAKQGFDVPLSIMGADYWDRIQEALLPGAVARDNPSGVKEGLMVSHGGRSYASVSHYLKLQGKQRTADQIRTYDALSAEIIESVDDAYVAPKLPGSFKRMLLSAALNRVGTVVAALRAFSNPDRQHQALLEGTQEFVRCLEAEAAAERSPLATALNSIRHFGRYMGQVSLPVTIAAEFARARIKKLFAGEEPEVRARVAYLERALPNNVTVDMGLAMYRLARSEELVACASAEDFAQKIAQRAFSDGFLAAWDGFMEKYGYRCPEELDVASPRFCEVPARFYHQLQAMARNSGGGNDPQAIYDRGAAERQEAYEFLLDIAHRQGRRQGRRFKKYYHILVTFGAYREIHKYYIVRIIGLFRKKALSAAHSLVAAGRLDRPEQVFDLTIEELDRGLADPTLDLRALADNNARFLTKIRHVRNFPRIIDSRGKILHPPARKTREDELVGEPISPGQARGRVKVLRRPDEKPVLPGDILVTRATDPGWTPLFLNAGGIILEVGGMLQHGAVVAREYGKPCVAGIENAASILKDGQMIEMDGASGVVQLLHVG